MVARSALKPRAAVSVPVSFSPVHGPSDESLSHPRVDSQPPKNPAERLHTQPATPPPQLESVWVRCVLGRDDGRRSPHVVVSSDACEG